MNYLIKWQFAKKNAIPLRAQREIIQSNFIPLVEDRFFQEKKYTFYITRIGEEDVRLAVFVEEKNLEDVKNVVKSHMNGLTLHPFNFDEKNRVWETEKHDWDGEARVSDYTFSENPSSNEYFHTKYLQDITWIGIDFHKKDIADAIKFSVSARFKTPPFENTNPKEILNDYFQKNEQYRNKNQLELEKFWGESGFYYRGSSAPGDHFYYNIILGRDFSPRPFWFSFSFDEKERRIALIAKEILKLHGLGNKIKNPFC